ncbi:MAG: PD40 domain-containing protein [Calditrichaeota bacterium]|nr:PD40 domain-containing protein [Calditrichota bacterium]
MNQFFILLTACISLISQDQVLFTRQIANNDDIYLIDKNGVERQITNHRSKDSSPVMSPDGNYIVFTSERVGWWKVWLYDLQKNEFKQLTNSSSAEYAPAWSPDSKWIVFVSGRGGNDDIYKMDINGGQLQQLTRNPESDNTPSWALNNRIYYSAMTNGVYQVFEMNPDGTDNRMISSGQSDKLKPQLSPDQKFLLYYSDADGNYEIYRQSLRDKTVKRLTNNPLMDIRPAWSADGKWIVFERGDKRRNQHIYMMDSDGNQQRQLTKSAYNYAPSFVTKNLN